MLACSLALAQEFEVASIKPAAPPKASTVGIRGGPGSADPTHINWTNASLTQILLNAYDVKNYQIEGPDWLNSQRYDIGVVVPEGATKEQVAVMWRNLLVSRFGFVVHKIQKEFPVDELQVGPRGHKLQENNEPIPDPATTVGFPLRPGADGKISLPRPAIVAMVRASPTGRVAQTTARAQPMSAFANLLSNQLRHPVLDKTGLTARYDFSVEYAPTDLPGLPALPSGAAPAGAAQGASLAPAAPEVGIDLAGALQQQLGLRLVKGKGMLDVIVVDKAEKVPSEN